MGQESGSGTVVPSEPGLDELAGQESETKGNVVTGTKRNKKNEKVERHEMLRQGDGFQVRPVCEIGQGFHE